MKPAINKAVCLLSLGGHAYDRDSLKIVAEWQRKSAATISFIALDEPEAVNQTVLGIDARPSSYFTEAINTIEWRHPISITSFSEILSNNPAGQVTVEKVCDGIDGDRRTRDLIRTQTYSSLYFSLREVGVRNQRDPLVDASARYLELELALLVHLRELGVEREITFHERGGAADELERLGFTLPQQVLLTRTWKSRSLVVDGLALRIPNSARTVGPVSFKVHAGQILGILGTNGAGKSTLLRGLAGHAAIHGGRIELAGTDVTRLSPYNRGFVTIFQDAGLIETLTGEENIELGMSAARKRGQEIGNIQAIETQLAVASSLKTRAGAMSGGERQMAAFVRSVASAPRCILLDEPTAALDRSRRERFIAVLKTEIWRHRLPAVVVSHDIDFILAVANNLLILAHDGTIAEIGSTDQLAGGATTLAACEVLGQRNILSITRTGAKAVLDEWVTTEANHISAPADAKGLRIPEAALHCASWEAVQRTKPPRGILRLQGVIKSRRITASGDFVLLSLGPSDDGDPVLPARARGLWLPNAATSNLASMRVAIDIELSRIIWLT